MKFPKIDNRGWRQALLGALILSLCLLPLAGLHLHPAETHLGQDWHAHKLETHAFHVHAAGHDNIDTESVHQSDGQSISLDLDGSLGKAFKAPMPVLLALLLLAVFAIKCVTVRSDYPLVLPTHFEIYRALLRGPPAR